MAHEKISTCVIAYNEEDYIVQCLKSIMLQEGVCISEILVGINSSTDNTRKLVEEFGKTDTRVKVIDSPKGKAYAWNALNEVARNDLRIFQDGDSFAPKHAYKTLLSSLNKADIVGSCIEKRTINADFFVRVANFPKRHVFLNPKLNGCLYAFLFSRLSDLMLKNIHAKEMPYDIINDDAFLNMVADKVIVIDKVFTLVIAESSVKEVIRRYKRMRQGLYQLNTRYPELFERRLSTFNKGNAFRYYFKLFQLSNFLEKLLFVPAMTIKFFFFRYIMFRISKASSDLESIDWK